MGLFDQTTTTNTAKTQNSSSQTNPWAPQAGYLTQGFATAAGNLGAPAPSNLVAQYTPDQLAAYNKMLAAGTDPSIANSSAAVGSELGASGAQGAGQGLYGLSNFQSGNTVGNVTNAASAYSQNPDVQGMIDAATRDAKRSYSEQIAPGIERNAAATGNINSNRTGIAQGVAARGLADTVANTSANIRGGLYQHGLDLGQTQAANADASKLGALGALTSGGTNAANAGVNANTGAVNQQGGLFNIANAGVTGQLAGEQAKLNNPIAQAQFLNQQLQNYWNIVGGQNYGTSTNGTITTNGTETATQTPSTMAQIGQVGGILSSFL